MSCSSCGGKETSKVALKSSYVPTPNKSVKMSEVLLSLTVEKKKTNDTTGANKENT